ncbi:TIGR04222 domain-containing membrane protein [Parafrankia discariae]|uniref:TIGR04222 domain-containing membrane protein n=1 Tax=Parafrankia discariae TaxID=365528 RepID=UPI0003A2A1F6|nr:TIGR04222 domain-containing membrane protein [Parafrankia discariae]
MAISLGYLFTVLAAIAALVALRAAAVRGHGAGQPDPQSVPAEDLALIGAGPKRAALTALVGLYEAGAIHIPLTWRLGVSGPLPAGSTPLAASAHRLIAAAGQPRVRVILQRLADGPELRAARARLAAAGHVPPAGLVGVLSVLRLLLPVSIAVAALTLLGYGAGVPGLVVPVALAGVLAVIVLAGPAPATRDGRRLVEAARIRRAGYADGGVPGQRAVAVALFGPAALWRADATVANRLGVGPRPQDVRGGGRGGPAREYTRSTDAGDSAFGGIAGWLAFGGDDSHHGGSDGWGGGHSWGGWGGGHGGGGGGGGHGGGHGGGCGGGGGGCGGGGGGCGGGGGGCGGG